MIIGLGNDIVDIRRIERTLARFGRRFEMRVFSENERKLAMRRRHPAATYAKRFAAKEACAKALGTGLRQGVFWRDMQIVKLRSGAPTMKLSGGAAKRLEVITQQNISENSENIIPQINVSLSDEYPLAQAIVIISLRKSQSHD